MSSSYLCQPNTINLAPPFFSVDIVDTSRLHRRGDIHSQIQNMMESKKPIVLRGCQHRSEWRELGLDLVSLKRVYDDDCKTACFLRLLLYTNYSSCCKFLLTIDGFFKISHASICTLIPTSNFVLHRTWMITFLHHVHPRLLVSMPRIYHVHINGERRSWKQ